MVDVVSRKKRSQMMSGIRSVNTKPEMIVRSLLHSLGLRFRVHTKIENWKPDIVLKRHKTVILVHGCYWHRHNGCKYCYTPKTRVEFWNEKFQTNVERDKKSKRLLRKLGWKVIVVWECETKNIEKLERRLKRHFNRS